MLTKSGDSAYTAMVKSLPEFKCHLAHCGYSCFVKSQFLRHQANKHNIVVPSGPASALSRSTPASVEVPPSRVLIEPPSRLATEEEAKVSPGKEKESHPRKKYFCGAPACQFETNYMSSLKRHKVKLHPPASSVLQGEERFSCPHCSYQTISGVKFLEHMTEHEQQAQLTVATHACCVPGCGSRFKLANTLRQHMADRHNVNVKWVYCDKCDYRAKRPSTLKQHRADMHDIDFVWHYCTEQGCEYRAKTKTRVRLHLAGCHNIGATYVSCSEPGCTYKCKAHQCQNLKRHLVNVHNIGINWLTCSYGDCAYRAKSKSHMKSHVNLVHRKKESECFSVETVGS